MTERHFNSYVHLGQVQNTEPTYLIYIHRTEKNHVKNQTRRMSLYRASAATEQYRP